MKDSLKTKLAVSMTALLCALPALLTGCGVIPTYVPPGYEQPAAVSPAPVATYAPPTTPAANVPGNPQAVAPGASPVEGIDWVRVGDKLIITFNDVNPPMQPFEAAVREDGMITLPYNRKVKAAGKIRSDVEEEIHALYVPKIFKQMTPSIKVEDRFYTVGGEVRTPSRQIYVGTMTVLKAIASCGGFTEFARKTKVDIIRSNGKKETVDAIKAQEDPRYDMPIYPGDQIFVHRRII